MIKYLIPFKKKVISFIKNKPKHAIGNGEFARRIRLRHKLIETAQDAGIIRKAMMSVSDPIDKWHDGDFWQRKLNNKYNSREFVKMHNCKVPELYWKGQDIASINFDTLPRQFVIRPITGHSAAGIFLMDNGTNLMEKRAYSEKELKRALCAQLHQNTNLEFLIEEFVRTENGEYEIPKDYKFFTFNGEIACILITTRRNGLTLCYTSYDKYWNKMLNPYVNSIEDYDQEPPKCLPKMLEQVKRLSQAYEIFVRIDFYSTDKGPVFGEFTPTPSKGNYFALPVDKKFTSYWNNFCAGKI